MSFIFKSSDPILVAARQRISVFDPSTKENFYTPRAVITKGSFDLLHYGHLALINYCVHLKNNGGESQSVAPMVVLVESTESVKNRKGPTRPVLDEADRALQIAVIPGVDRVFIVNYADLEIALNFFSPSIYVKGIDTLHGVTTGKDQAETIAKNSDVSAALSAGANVHIFCDDGAMSTSQLLDSALLSIKRGSGS